MITQKQSHMKAWRQAKRDLRRLRNKLAREEAQALKFKAKRYAKERKACEETIEDLQIKVATAEVKEARLRPEGMQ